MAVWRKGCRRSGVSNGIKRREEEDRIHWRANRSIAGKDVVGRNKQRQVDGLAPARAGDAKIFARAKGQLTLVGTERRGCQRSRNCMAKDQELQIQSQCRQRSNLEKDRAFHSSRMYRDVLA